MTMETVFVYVTITCLILSTISLMAVDMQKYKRPVRKFIEVAASGQIFKKMNDIIYHSRYMQ